MTARVRSSRTLTGLAVVGLTLAFGIPELGLPKLLFADTAIGSRVGREIVWVGLAALVLLWVTRVEGLPLASIGLVRPSWSTVIWGLIATIALLASVMLTFAVIAPAFGLSQNAAATNAVVEVPLWLLFTTPVVAGVSEEIVYRGYAIERLTFLTGERWLAAIIAGAMFLVVHVAWGGAQMIIVTFATIMLSALYLWRRDLPCVIVAHTLTNLIGFLLARAQM